MVCYDLNKEKIPFIVSELLEITTASEIDQQQIAKDFVKNLNRKHRTSQQLLIKLLSNIIKEYSESDSDPRNRAAVNWSRDVSKINNNFPFV